MLWKARKDNAVEFDLINLRDFGLGSRRQVDDTPYGGGDGMLLMIEPLKSALDEAKKRLPEAKVILMSPSKVVWNQVLAKEYSVSNDDYIIVCGHYEGVDARIEQFVDEKISIGNFVLTGGELPAMVIIDSITRLLSGVLGGESSTAIESYSDGGNLEFPQYTRPSNFDGLEVPEILLSGNHGAIAKWREENSGHADS